MDMTIKVEGKGFISNKDGRISLLNLNQNSKDTSREEMWNNIHKSSQYNAQWETLFLS
jgi:hypothetical protein